MSSLLPSPFLRFDFADTLGLPGPVCFSKPERVIVAHDVSEVAGALRAVEEGTRQGFYAAGFVAYEAAPAFDDALVTHGHGRARRSSRSSGSDSSASPQPAPSSASNDVSAAAWKWEPDITPADYRAGIDAVKEAIARGDTYQVNYTFRLRAGHR